MLNTLMKKIARFFISEGPIDYYSSIDYNLYTRGLYLIREDQMKKEVRKETHIRWMIRRDMPEILNIENLCFEFKWNEEDFIRCLRQRNCIGMVAEIDAEIVGFMIYELHSSHLNIVNFAIRPDHQKKGIGRKQLDKLKNKLTPERRSYLSLIVRESNLQAQLFLKKEGFVARKIHRNYYDDCEESGYYMEYSIVKKSPTNRVSKFFEDLTQ